MRYTTTIPRNLGLQASTGEVPIKGGAVLDVQLNGSYNSNVINNTGVISILGDVTGRGRHHFVNASGAGGESADVHTLTPPSIPDDPTTIAGLRCCRTNMGCATSPRTKRDVGQPETVKCRRG